MAIETTIIPIPVLQEEFAANGLVNAVVLSPEAPLRTTTIMVEQQASPDSPARRMLATWDPQSAEVTTQILKQNEGSVVNPQERFVPDGEQVLLAATPPDIRHSLALGAELLAHTLMTDQLSPRVKEGIRSLRHALTPPDAPATA